jgi:hypothetical protein
MVRLFAIVGWVCACRFGSPLIAAEGYFFCLDTKEAKNQVSRKASLPHRPYAHNPVKPGLQQVALHYVPLIGLHFCKLLLCPTAAQPTIVLPYFGRSCSADGLSMATSIGFYKPFRYEVYPQLHPQTKSPVYRAL